MASSKTISDKINMLSKRSVINVTDVWRYNSVLSGQNYQLTYGAPTIAYDPSNPIRDGNGRYLFMIGFDLVGSSGKVGS